MEADMKNLFLALGVFSLLGLAGCSTTSPTNTSNREYDDRFDTWVDGKKVANIENAAKNRNVRVIWITYPAKATEAH